MDITDLIELGDSDELLREVDRLCERRDWPGLLRLRDLCRAATERGKQLWGAAGHAEYRMALEAIPSFAAPIVEADPGRFVLGPLTEVVASSHTWAELAPYLPIGPLRVAVAYERIMRNEDLRTDSTLTNGPTEFGLPLVLEPWEPSYALAEYKAHELRAPKPRLTMGVSVPLSPVVDVELIDDPAVDALAQLVQPWLVGSNGAVQVSAVSGGLDQVLWPLGARNASRISAEEALATMAWAAASGGAHGVRAGAGAGRAKLWWALASLAQEDAWPHPGRALGEYVNDVEWWTWDPDDLSSGWSLRICVVDRAGGSAFAINAVDRPDDSKFAPDSP